jgi:hypothetical protein
MFTFKARPGGCIQISEYKKAKPAAFKWKKLGLAACKMLQGGSMAALKGQKGGVSHMQEVKTRV